MGKITFSSGNEQHDVWDGFGNHLSTSYYVLGSDGKLSHLSTKEYTGDGHVIVDGEVKYARFDGGYFDNQGNPYWNIADYLGNTIVSTDKDGIIIQANDYYPYGEPWREPAGQPFLYSGNERLRVDGLNEYDFNARRYNPVTAQFTTWDPFAEKKPWISPYSFCMGNPILLVDPSGLFESASEASGWAQQHGIQLGFMKPHKLYREEDGSWSIVNNRNHTSYSRDHSLDNFENVIGRSDDGVTQSVISYASSPSIFKEEALAAWNSDFFRNLIPDFVDVGVGFSGIAGIGANSSIELNWVLRGPEASWKPIVSVTQGVGGGFPVDATINLGGSNYLGSVYEIDRDMIETTIKDGNAGLFFAIGETSLTKIGVTFNVTHVNNTIMFSSQLNVGLGIPLGPFPVNYAVGTYNTYNIYDNY